MKLGNYRSQLDRGASRWTETLWMAVKSLLFIPYQPIPSRFRVWVLRRFGAQVGSGVIIRSQVDITFPWRLSIGDDVWIGEGVKILNLATVTIGSNCCISQRAFLCTGSHRFDLPGFDLVTKPITIEEGSWVAAQCFIGPGVTIGPDSLCAAGSVVVKDVPSESIVGGNPAQKLGEQKTGSPPA